MSQMDDKKNNLEFLFSIIFFCIIITFSLIKQKKKVERLFELINNKHLWISIFLIIVWCVYWLFISKNKNVIRYKNATKQAILGIIIAIFAYLDLIIAPFWFVWITAFFMKI